jgi:hypothetical protein
MNRVSLFHRISSREWENYLYTQIFCRGIRRYSRHKWQLFPGWKDIYERYKGTLKDLKQPDIEELNIYISDNSLDWSADKVRNLIEMEQLPIKTIEE